MIALLTFNLRRMLNLRSALLHCLIAALPVTVSATIIPITSLADTGVGTLRETIGNASSGDTLEFTLAGTISLDSQIEVMDSVTIMGLGADQTEINGQGQTRLFEVEENAALNLIDLSLADGNAGSDPGGVIFLGGAIRAKGGVNAIRCHFTRNVGIAGGAIYFEGYGGNQFTAFFRDCTFSYNRTDIPAIPNQIPNVGGAIYSDGRYGGDVDIVAVNCTFSNNHAGKDGGAIFLVHFPGGNTNFEGIHCTITDNSCDDGVGGVENSQADPLGLYHCIISGNEGQKAVEDVYGPVRSRGYNVIGNGALSFTPDPTDSITTDPGLGALGEYYPGLPTHSLACESPALDAGQSDDTLLVDQGGRGRIGLSDIGAHERSVSEDLAVTNLLDDGGNSLREVIRLSCPGDTIWIASLGGEIPLTSPILVDKDIVVHNASESSRQIVFSGNLSTNLMEVSPGVTTSWKGFTFTQGNSVAKGGGAIFNQGHLTLEGCTFFANQAVAGGAIANYANEDSSSLILRHCTLSGNVSTDFTGGAIDNRSYDHAADLTLTHVTLVQNEALFRGGGIFVDEGAGQVVLDHTLIGTNSCEEGPDVYGAITSVGHNLIGRTSGIQWTPQSTDLVEVYADVDPLGSYGGITPTHRLRAGSPAIDAGAASSAYATDQRGYNRLVNQHVDIGAFEFDAATSSPDPVPHSFSIRPNPVSSTFEVRLPTGQTDLSLTNLQGQELAHWSFISDGEWQRLDLPAERIAMPAGIYLLRAIQENHLENQLIQIR